MSKAPDYSDYLDEKPSDEAFAEIAALVTELREASKNVANAEAELKLAQARLRDVAEKRLPEKMEAMGLDEFKHASGLGVRLKDVFGVSLPKKEPERYERGLDWLEGQGHGKIIKRAVRAAFKKGQEAEAADAARRLQEMGYPVKILKEVHPSTLKKFIKERLEAGEDVPDDIFGIHSAKVAEIIK